MGCKWSKDQDKADASAEADAQEGNAAADKPADELGESPRLITVFGATGMQGGSVVKALLKDPKYKVRAITRDPESEAAKQLTEQGAEVVKANFDETETLATAMDGAYGAFLVTNYWAHTDMDKEVEQGKAVVDACKTANVEHLVFSGLESVKEAFGKSCPHFDGKALITDYIVDQEVPYTAVHLSLYMENLLSQMKPTKNEDGDYTIGVDFGDKPLYMVSALDCGECVRAIFDEPDEYKGKKIGLASDSLKIDEYAAILTKLCDKNIVASKVTPEGLAELEIPNSKELSVMFEYLAGGEQERDMELTKKLHPEITTFEKWVENNKDAIIGILE